MKFEGSINHRITYIALREIKVIIKHGEIQYDPTIKKEEERRRKIRARRSRRYQDRQGVENISNFRQGSGEDQENFHKG